MRIYNFSQIYLGGSVDLLRLRSHLTQSYPGAGLELVRGNQVLNIPLASGTIEQAKASIEYQVVCHQFGSGFGSLVIVMNIKNDDPTSAIEMANWVVHSPEISLASLKYFNRVFGIPDFGELYAHLRDPAQRRQFLEGPGIELLVAGQDRYNIGLHVFDCYWMVGGEEISRSGWHDLTADRGLLWAKDNKRFWSPGDDEDLYWDMVIILYREHSVSCCLEFIRGWMGVLKQQLVQTREILGHDDGGLWQQERDALEAVELNFLSCDINYREFLSSQEYLYRHDHPPAALRLLEPGRWEVLSRYRSRRVLINDLLSECQYVLERMTRPLDIREFRFIRSGVEGVETKIVLLTLLLVIIGIFTQAFRPGHWSLKVGLFLLLISIASSFIIWVGLWRSRIRRRGRLLYLKSMKKRAEGEAEVYQRQMMTIKEDRNITPAVRDHYLSNYEERFKRIEAKMASLDDEIRKLQKMI